MPYRQIDLSHRLSEIEQELQTTQMVLKLLPDVITTLRKSLNSFGSTFTTSA